MSADNQILVMSYLTEGTQVVRVLECSVSGQAYEVARAMSTRSENKNFLEFPADEYAKALETAWKIDSIIQTEYGVREISDWMTFSVLRDNAADQYRLSPRLQSVVRRFVEGDAAFFASLPPGYFVEYATRIEA